MNGKPCDSCGDLYDLQVQVAELQTALAEVVDVLGGKPLPRPKRPKPEIKYRPRTPTKTQPRKNEVPNPEPNPNGWCDDEYTEPGDGHFAGVFSIWRCTKPKDHPERWHRWNNSTIGRPVEEVVWAPQYTNSITGEVTPSVRICNVQHMTRHGSRCEFIYGHDSPEHGCTYKDPVERVRWDDDGNTRTEDVAIVTSGNPLLGSTIKDAVDALRMPTTRNLQPGDNISINYTQRITGA